jgi:predicted RNase H-like HicB family nuclease
MKALTVIIEKTENNYSAYLAEVDGIVATGHNIDEIKANIVNAITALLEDCQEYGDEIPEEWTKMCPCFDAKEEYSDLLAA